jgi:hypothetical protein
MSPSEFYKWLNVFGVRPNGYGKTVVSCGIPVIVVPTGTIDGAGNITLGTALAVTYSNAWIYLPAGAISGGSAGLYFAKFTTTTVGIVYTNYNAGTLFTPNIPTAPVAAVGVGAYTQTTAADLSLIAVTIPGGSMGLCGGVEVKAGWSALNNANAKTLKYNFAGVSFGGGAISLAGITGAWLVRGFYNRGVANAQIALASSSIGSYGSAGSIAMAISTSVDQVVSLTANLAVATDYVVLESLNITTTAG